MAAEIEYHKKDKLSEDLTLVLLDFLLLQVSQDE